MTNTLQLKAEIKKSGIAKEYLAEKLNLSNSLFEKKIDNIVEFNVAEMYTLIGLLNINKVDDVFFVKYSDL